MLRDGLAQRGSDRPAEVAQQAGQRGQRGRRRGQDQQQVPPPRQRRGRAGGGGQQQSSLSGPLWAKVVKGEQYLIVNAANSATILYLDKILEEYPEVKMALNITGSTVLETIETLKKFKPLLILTPAIEYPPRIGRQQNQQFLINAARIAHEAGLEVAFSTSGNTSEALRDTPLFAVAYLIKTGLPRKTALEALTLKPAQVMGLTERLGAIEPKKDANLLIFNGDPLDPSSRLLRVMVEGKFVYENKTQ